MIAGKIQIPSKEEMEKSLEAERAEEATLDDEEKMIKFQGKYCDHLAELTGETKVGGQGGKHNIHARVYRGGPLMMQ